MRSGHTCVEQLSDRGADIQDQDVQAAAVRTRERRLTSCALAALGVIVVIERAGEPL